MTDIDKVKDQLGDEPNEALDQFIVYDYCNGNFLYIGAILGEFDCADDEGEILVTSKAAAPKIDKFNTFMKKNEDTNKVFKKYMRKQAQLYVVQQKW